MALPREFFGSDRYAHHSRIEHGSLAEITSHDEPEIHASVRKSQPSIKRKHDEMIRDESEHGRISDGNDSDSTTLSGARVILRPFVFRNLRQESIRFGGQYYIQAGRGGDVVRKVWEACKSRGESIREIIRIRNSL